MVQDDSHPIANKPGYRAEKRGSKASSSMPAHRSGYEHHGGHEDVVHEPRSTQAKGKQDPSCISHHSTGYGNGYAHQSGFKDDVHEPSSTKAQGSQAPSSTSAHSTGYGNGAPSSMSIHSTGYGGGYERQSGHKDVHEPCSTQSQGQQPPSSMSNHSTRYGNGYERSGFVHDPPSTQAHGKLGKGNVYDSNTGIHGSSRTEGRENQSHVQKPPSSEVIGKQSSLVSSSRPRLVNDQFVVHKDPTYERPPTETKPSHISLLGHGKENARNPPPPPGKSYVQTPVGDGENANVPKSVPSDALPLDPQPGHDQVNWHRDPTSSLPRIQVNVNVNYDPQAGTYGVNLAPHPTLSPPQPQPPPLPPPHPQPRLQPQLRPRLQPQLRPRPQPRLQPQLRPRSQPLLQPQLRPRLRPQPPSKPHEQGCCTIL